MKLVLSVFTCLIITFSSFAQGQRPASTGAIPGVTGKITGSVTDSLTKKPVDFATVAISRSGDARSINGTISDDKGNFTLENIAPGKYRISVSFIGFKTKVIDPVDFDGTKLTLSLGNIILSPTANILQAVEIQGEAILVENRVDKLVYNAEKDLTSTGGDASDILRKVPMLSVDLDGNVQLRGSSNIRVLINGKPSGSMAASVADALAMIPADEIKSVEVITSPSARYDAEGTAGIINIITKKTTLFGVNGSVNASAGTRRNNAGVNLNIRNGNFGINSRINGNFFIPQTSTVNFFRQDFLNNDTRTLSQNGNSKTSRFGGSGSVGFDWDINAFNNLSSNIRYNRFESSFDGLQNAIFEDPNAANQIYDRDTDQTSNRNGLDFSIDYRKTFKKPQQELSFAAEFNTNDNFSNYNLFQSGNQAMLNRQERSFNNGTNNENTFQFDYVQPFAKESVLEFGAKTVFRTITSDYTYELFNHNNNQFEVDNNRTNAFSYGQDVFAAYSTLSFGLGSGFTVKGGLRYEYTKIGGEFDGAVASFSNDYDNFVPSVTFAKRFKDFKTVRLSYSRRIQRPGFRFLNPYVNSADVRNIEFGNPNLAPELTDNFELGFGGLIGKVSVNASLYYRNTRDVIESVLIVDPNGVSITTFDNIAKSNAFGFNTFGSFQITNRWNLRGNANVFYNKLQSARFNSEGNSGVDYNFNLNTSFTIVEGLAAEAFGLINSPRRTLQGTNASFSLINFGVRKDLFNKKGSLGLGLSNPFKRERNFGSELRGDNFFQSNQVAVPFRSINLNFRYSFGKLETQRRPRGERQNINNDIKQGEEGGEGGGNR